MKKLKLIIIALVICSIAKAQQVSYNHDAHGNRTQRKLVVLSSSSRMNPKDSSTYNEETMKLAMEYGVSVFPNPTQSNVNLALNKLPENATSTAILLDNMGKILQTFNNVNTKEEIPLTNYKAGIYYLSITINEKDKLFYKIVKQ